jgi:hypothetical protein
LLLIVIVHPARDEINNKFVAQQIFFSCPPTQLKAHGPSSMGCAFDEGSGKGRVKGVWSFLKGGSIQGRIGGNGKARRSDRRQVISGKPERRRKLGGFATIINHQHVIASEARQS